MRRHLFFFFLLAAEAAAILFFHAVPGKKGSDPGPAAVARVLSVTDLAVWTEARYTRHPSQADFFSPFQESPAAPDYFPAGSIVSPPPHLPGRGAR